MIGRGSGQEVSVLALYSDDPMIKSRQSLKFFCKLMLKGTKINKKEAGVGPIKKVSS